LSGEIIAGIPKDASVTIVGGPACADGYRWYQISYQGMSGWSVETGPDGLYSLYPVGTAMPDSSAPQQTSSLQTFACSLWSFFCPQETGARAWEFQKYQCTWYAAERRPDVYNWMPTYGVNARYWADIAAQNGIPVSSASDWTFRVDYDHVRPGDLVVFQPGCVSADLNYGHVAYVESVDYPNEIIHISEYNAVYENNYSERDMFIYWCMSFIH
jgi:surface antigen